MRIDVIGVYPVVAPEPCHLIEVQVADGALADAVASITQENFGQPADDWQVPYDEHFLTPHGTNAEEPASATAGRVAFFFHYLDLRRPLLTAAGPVPLPVLSPRPARLDFMHYEPPAEFGRPHVGCALALDNAAQQGAAADTALLGGVGRGTVWQHHRRVG